MTITCQKMQVVSVDAAMKRFELFPFFFFFFLLGINIANPKLHYCLLTLIKKEGILFLKKKKIKGCRLMLETCTQTTCVLTFSLFLLLSSSQSFFLIDLSSLSITLSLSLASSSCLFKARDGNITFFAASMLCKIDSCNNNNNSQHIPHRYIINLIHTCSNSICHQNLL